MAAPPYYVDDEGDGSSEDSWATADTSINNLDAEYAFASGEIVYFGHDHVCQATNSANLTIILPGAAPPTYFISATQGSSPPTYAASTTAQIDTTEGAYDIIIAGSVAMYGISMKSGDDFILNGNNDEPQHYEACRFAPAASQQIALGAKGFYRFVNCVIDLTADGTTPRSGAVIFSQMGQYLEVEFIGLTFVNAGYRTGAVFDQNSETANYRVSGADFSGFTNGTTCEIVGATVNSRYTFSNCLTAATWVPYSNPYPFAGMNIMFTNCGPANAPTYLYYADGIGSVLSTSAIYRTSGAQIDSTSCAWLVTTLSICAEGSLFALPWIYDDVASTGSKTFDLYITNDTADFNDSQVWLEVEFLGTATEAIGTLASDHRTITTTAAAQTDDTTSTWNGTGPSFTYKQKLSVTATVNVAGMFRARVVTAVASIASSRYFYIDPQVTAT